MRSISKVLNSAESSDSVDKSVDEMWTTMKIEFDKTPDPTGLGRIIVDGKYYGLPVEAVTYLGIVSALAADWQKMMDQNNTARPH